MSDKIEVTVRKGFSVELLNGNRHEAGETLSVTPEQFKAIASQVDRKPETKAKKAEK